MTSTDPHPNVEVKPFRAQSVRPWETRMEACVLSSFFRCTTNIGAQSLSTLISTQRETNNLFTANRLSDFFIVVATEPPTLHLDTIIVVVTELATRHSSTRRRARFALCDHAEHDDATQDLRVDLGGASSTRAP